MLQTEFDRITRNIGGVYLPCGEKERYELVALAVAVGNGNNNIKVIILNADGTPALGAWARHEYGTNEQPERKQYMGGLPAQFNLGPGSHYSVPNDPPDRITVEGLPSDRVHLGNSSLIGFQHTEWTLTFRRTSDVPITPEPPSEPEPGIYVTRAEARAIARDEINAMLKRAEA